MRYAQHIHAVTVSLLAVLLALTSLEMAVARGQTRSAGEIVICTGYGISSIDVDENGDPTGPPHICPDMVLAMLAALPVPMLALCPPHTLTGRIHHSEPQLPAAHSQPAPRARDPPPSV